MSTASTSQKFEIQLTTNLTANTALQFILTHCEFKTQEQVAKAAEAILHKLDTVKKISEVQIRYQNKTSKHSINSKTVKLARESAKIFGFVDILYEDETQGVYILNIEPGRTIPRHVHKVMTENEMTIDPGLIVNGTEVQALKTFSFGKDNPHEYKNPTNQILRVLCIDKPKFIPKDEILTP